MKKLLSAVLAAALAVSAATTALAAGAVQLSDVQSGAWYYEEVNDMVAAGYISGYEDGSFRPENEVSVAEFVTMTARCEGLETGEEYGHWAGVQMRNAYDSGWLTEEDAAWTEFNTPVTRELASKILCAALGLEQGDAASLSFTDAAGINPDYASYVAAMVGAGLLNGFEDGSFRPQSALTRAQAAVLIYRATQPEEPETETPDSGGEDDEKPAANLVETAPDGTPFASSTRLGDYDNGNFSISVENGVATVTVTHVELWTDAPDPESEDEAERSEAQRRERIYEAIAQPRRIPLQAAVSAVYELPCSTWFPGSDANAVIATANGKWYYVDLCGAANDGVPAATELTALDGQSVEALDFRTTSHTSGASQVVGSDYIVAVLTDGRELLAWSSDTAAAVQEQAAQE